MVPESESTEVINLDNEKEYKFKSTKIEAAVRNILNKSQEEPVTYEELKKIESLYICGQQIYDNWEEHFVYGANQYMIGSKYKAETYQTNGEITTVEDLSYMPNLKRLALYNQRISDISPLEKLYSLTYLGLGSNYIGDLEPLLELPWLQYLDVSANPITNKEIEQLNTLSILWGLDLSGTKVTSIYGIRNMKLNYLSLYECKMGDCNGLEKMTTLDNLILTGVNNAITERAIDKVALLSNLKILKIFDSGNFNMKKLSNLKSLELIDLCGMRERVNFKEMNLPGLNQIYISNFKDLDLSGLEMYPKLTEIFIPNSNCSDYSPLLKITNLKKVYCNQEQSIAILEQLGNIPFELIID